MSKLNGELFRFEIVGGNDDNVECFIDETIDNGCVWFDYELPINSPNYPFSSKQEEGPEADFIMQSANKHKVVINVRGTRYGNHN